MGSWRAATHGATFAHQAHNQTTALVALLATLLCVKFPIFLFTWTEPEAAVCDTPRSSSASELEYLGNNRNLAFKPE